ncbi:Uncharacterised protein [Segatella copri]|nr:Uncharacterised protein [Segatella copri]
MFVRHLHNLLIISDLYHAGQICPDKFNLSVFFSWKEASFTVSILTPVFVKSVIYPSAIFHSPMVRFWLS